MSYLDVIPVEIFDIILRNLGLDDIVKCRLVSKKWKFIVDTLLQTEGIWQHLCQNQLPDHGKSMMKKSELPWSGICRNVCLWRNIVKAITKRSIVPILQGTKLLDFHIYKGHLIRVGETNVTYHKVQNFALVRKFNIKCKDFDENDFMFLLYDQHFGIHLHGKSHKDDTFKANTMIQYASENAIAFYVLQDDYCIMIDDKGVLSECRWHKDHFQSTFLAKWFGPISGILDLLVLDKEILLVLVKNQVLKLDREVKQLYIADAVLAPQHPRSPKDSTQKESRFYITRKEKRSLKTSPQATTLIGQVSLALSRKGNDNGLSHPSSDVSSTLAPEIEHVIPNVKYLNTNRIKQVYLQHGEMLIMGFKDRVSFYAKEKVKKGIFKPDYKIVFNYDRTEEDGGYFILNSLVKIDVYESKDRHYLFVQNFSNLFKITLKYPSDLKKGLLGKLEDDCAQDEIYSESESFEHFP